MAREILTLIDCLKPLVPGIRGLSAPEWGAHAGDHRSRIRDSLRDTLNISEGMELSPPRSTDWSISISHSRKEGGWLAVPRPARIGFDIEQIERIQPHIIERTCDRQEIAGCPNPAFLWSAKESLYKALEHEQPQAVTQLKINDWKKLNSNIFSFSSGRGDFGVLVVDEESIFAASLLVSN